MKPDRTKSFYHVFKSLLIISAFVFMFQFSVYAQDVVVRSHPTNPINSWILHTPNDGRTSLYIAPRINGDWAWQNQVMITNNGNLGTAGAPPLEGLTTNGNLLLRKTGNWLSEVKFSNTQYSAEIVGFQSGPLTNNLGFVFRTEQGGASGASVKVNAMTIRHTGSVVVGTPVSGAPLDNYKLNVFGGVRANSIVVNTNGADFVFANNYRLRPLSEVEFFIKRNHHLPEIAPAAQMQEEGVSVGELQTQLLQKVEELTLYLIEQNKEIVAMKRQLQELKTENNELKTAVISSSKNK